ncbi:dienelactone hydrolase family protein [Endozoicomonas arenosclerae]|uniref:carboxylesterase family protein n=1 Tax=Endozoicomonas arenosclerae TaxID=1633495 RepID=UPI0009A21DFB|nr:alpha/beta hydrolase-fold protein [Endozoicomonas arenosclerae]
MRLSATLLSCLLILLPDSLMASWSISSYEKDGFILPYQLYSPSLAEDEKAPLVIYLHDAVEAGTDNRKQLYTGQNIGPDYFTSQRIQSMQKAYVLAPQTPRDSYWVKVPAGEFNYQEVPSSIALSALLKLIDKLAERSEVDPKRIYLVGHAQGGTGVWFAALSMPELFAAVAPLAGASSPDAGKRLTQTPIWAFHGDSDKVTPVLFTRNMVDAIIRAGGTSALLRYTEIEGGNHDSAWREAFKGDQLWQWLLKHKN